jgi:hypothetical protein
MNDVTGQLALDFTQDKCEKISTDDSGWETLYKEIANQQYWHLSYPESGNHGGGEPLVSTITKKAAAKKFNVQL